MAANALGQTNIPTVGTTAPIAGAIEILPTPNGDGSGYCCTVQPGDTITYGAIRAYIAYGREAAHANGAAAERWYRWDWYIPPGFYAQELISLMQFHDTPDSGALPVVFPNFELMAQGDDLWCWVPLDCVNRGQTPRYPTGVGVLKLSQFSGRWIHCAVHSNWSNANDGYLEVYIDDTLMVREWFKPNAYNDLVGPYWVVGIYDWSHSGLSRKYQLWHRNAQVFNTGHAVQEVLGAPPRIPQQVLII